MVMAYSRVLVYLLWLTLGWFGVHHLYLRRDRHAFVWLWTCGGGVLGWLVEVCRLDDYIHDANRELSQPLRGVSPRHQSSWSVKRIVGEMVFSMLIGALAIAAIPTEYYNSFPTITTLVSTFAVAAGVHTVANIGYEQCHLRYCVFGAFLPSMLFIFPVGVIAQDILFYACVGSVICANWNKSVRNQPPKHATLCRRVIVYSLANLAVISLFIGAIYFNGSITNQYGETVKVRDAIQNILASPAWAELKKTITNLWMQWWIGGFEDFRRHLSVALDPDGEEHAYRILNVSSGASEEEIHKSFKRLAKLYHPDKVLSRNDAEKKIAEEKFVAINQAYERLSNIRARRTKKNEL